jgi:hypothetical protein
MKTKPDFITRQVAEFVADRRQWIQPPTATFTEVVWYYGNIAADAPVSRELHERIQQMPESQRRYLLQSVTR